MDKVLPEHDIYLGELNDFGTELTSRLVHDAVMRYDPGWKPEDLRAMSKHSLFMTQGQSLSQKPPQDRTPHEHVLVRIFYAIQELEDEGDGSSR